MQHLFEELDFQNTPLGEISLRKRSEPRLNNKIIYEVKMNEEFLMSSLFVEAERQLAHLGLAQLDNSELSETPLDVIVGGLGLGYTAYATLQTPNVRTLNVIDVMQPVIDWHQQGLVPIANKLTSDERCTLVLGDFFALATAPTNGFFGINEDKKVHAVLLDIDHTPSFWLSPENSSFYSEKGLTALADKILPGGVFGLWSDEQSPNKEFIIRLENIFDKVETQVVTFPNPYTQEKSSNTVYLARVS